MARHRQLKRITAPALAISGVLILGAVLAPAAAAQSQRPGASGAPKATSAPKAATASKTAPAATSVPFNAGERLSYRVIWSKFSVNAATIQLSVIERRDFFGRLAWHFRALAQTIDTMH